MGSLGDDFVGLLNQRVSLWTVALGVRFGITSDLSIGNLVIEELQAAMAGRNAWR